jgi:hypothetical protein
MNPQKGDGLAFRSEKISCRLAIQVCVGRFPDGRARHRTFSLKNISPGASLDALRALVASIARVLAYPVTKARLIIKVVRAVFGAGRREISSDPSAKNAEITLAQPGKIGYNNSSSQQSAVSSQQSAVSSQQSAVSSQQSAVLSK